MSRLLSILKASSQAAVKSYQARTSVRIEGALNGGQHADFRACFHV
jgi:hypothetical protein